MTEDPQGFHAGLNFYAYAGNNPLSNSDPTGLDVYLGGSREGVGHFWVAVDTPMGQIMRYDFSAANYTGGNVGSSGLVGDLLSTLNTSGRVELREFDTIAAAAGGNEFYRFKQSPGVDATVLDRMENDYSNPPSYGLIDRNCGDRSCQVASFDSIVGFHVMPSGFLDAVRGVRDSIDEASSPGTLIGPPTSDSAGEGVAPPVGTSMGADDGHPMADPAYFEGTGVAPGMVDAAGSRDQIGEYGTR
jgi:hypothetical protein